MGNSSEKTDVVAYSGYRANERPLYFVSDDRRLRVERVISRWIEPDKDIFKVIAEDGKKYILGWVRNDDVWLIKDG